jgi:hypothetical protein
MNASEIITMLKEQCPEFFRQAFDGEQYEVWTSRADRLFLIVTYTVSVYREHPHTADFSCVYEYVDGQLDEVKLFATPEYAVNSLEDARRYLIKWYHDARQIPQGDDEGNNER